MLDEGDHSLMRSRFRRDVQELVAFFPNQWAAECTIAYKFKKVLAGLCAFPEQADGGIIAEFQ